MLPDVVVQQMTKYVMGLNLVSNFLTMTVVDDQRLVNALLRNHSDSKGICEELQVFGPLSGRMAR